VLAALFEMLLRLTGLFDRLLSCLRDNRLIALGEQRARGEVLTRQEEIITRVKNIDNEVAAIHRRHLDDSAFDGSFERKDDV
jgi:hypothetical protein